MASRKRQLLDVLRAQHKEGPAHASAETPRPIAKPAVPRNRSLPPWLPAALRWGFGLVWVILIIWLLTLLWPDGAEPKDSDAVQGGSPAAAGNPPQPAPPASNAPAAAEAAASASGYGILAITYKGAANEKQATGTAIQLQNMLQPQPVKVRKHSEGGDTWYEIFIGQAAKKADLDALLKQVRSLSLPDQPTQKPFSSAYVKRIPPTTS